MVSWTMAFGVLSNDIRYCEFSEQGILGNGILNLLVFFYNANFFIILLEMGLEIL